MPSIDPRSIARVGKQIRAAERRPELGGIPARRAAKAVTIRPGQLCTTTTIITARTGSSPAFTLGSGQAQPLWLKSGVTSSNGAAITVYNTVASAIATGLLCQLKYIDGHWCVDVVDCTPTGSG